MYEAQKTDPSEGDFIDLVAKDKVLINLNMTDEEICRVTKEQFKVMVKSKINRLAMDYLKEKQQTHSKVRNIDYSKLETAEYLRSPLFNSHSIELLFSLRTRTVRGIRKDFQGMYADHSCPLACGDDDTLANVLACSVLQRHVQNNTVASEFIKYEDIFSNDVRKQRQVTELYSQLLTIREQLLDSSPVTETGPVH